MRAAPVANCCARISMFPAHMQTSRNAWLHVAAGLSLCLSLACPDQPMARVDDSSKSLATQPKPSPEYSPKEVVRLLVEALADNDDPYANAGIDTVYRFASPANKRITGPLAHFTLMLHGRTYGPMLDHTAAEYSPMRIQGGRARQAIVLTTAGGQRVGYVFELSLQKQPPYEGAWMTDSVVRFEVPSLQQARALS